MFPRLILSSLLVSVVFSDPTEMPSFPDTFTTDVIGSFKESKNIMSATMYYDKGNNRAALDMFFQEQETKMIFNFDDDQLITIQGTSCTIVPISKDNSFFPYTETTAKKTIGSAKEVLYFTNSVFQNRDEEWIVPLQMYCGRVDVPFYNKKNCKVCHQFTDPSVTDDCEGFSCTPTLVGVTVECDDEGVVKNEYQFYRFHDEVDDQKLQVPPGIYCNGKGTKAFPDMPPYFAFSYDLTEEWIEEKSARDVQVWYKELYYDHDYKLLRLNNYDDKKFEISAIQIYDFHYDVGYAITPTVGQCEVGPIPSDLTMATATLLPINLFLDQTGNKGQNLSYVGKRKQHGLSYYVWTSEFKKDVFKVVRELYFKKNFDGTDTLSLSHIEEFYYDMDEDRKNELEKVTFSPIRKFRTSPRDFSVFNVSDCYGSSFMKKFQLHLKVKCGDLPDKSTCPTDEKFAKETPIYNELLNNLYNKLTRVSGLSITRISSLEAVETSHEECVFRGVFLESPSVLAENIKVDLHLPISDAWTNIKNDIKGGGFTFFFFQGGQDYRFTATALEEITPSTVVDAQINADSSILYGQGSMAAMGVIMLLIGALLGIIGLIVFFRVRRGSIPYASTT